jgi:hypothetical protein
VRLLHILLLVQCSNAKVMDILKLEIQKKRKEIEEKKLLVRFPLANCDHSRSSHFFFFSFQC